MLFQGQKGTLAVFGIAVASLGSQAAADFVNPMIPVWRSAANADFYGWEIFNSAFGGPTVPNYTGTELGAALFNFGFGASIDAGGNMHAGSGPLSLTVLAGASDQIVEVIVNVATIGTLINDNSAVLKLSNNLGGGLNVTPSAVEIRSNGSAPNGQGQIQTRAYRFIVPPTGSILPRFELNLGSVSNNITLDTLSVDIRYVPAPGAMVLLAIAGTLAVGRRRQG